MTFDPVAALDDLQRRTTARLAALTGDYAGIVEASRDSNADDEHDPEGSTIAFERSQVGTLVADARRQLADVEAALGRPDGVGGAGGGRADGSYGRCAVCGRPIPAARLAARPTARTHVDCTA